GKNRVKRQQDEHYVSENQEQVEALRPGEQAKNDGRDEPCEPFGRKPEPAASRRRKCHTDVVRRIAFESPRDGGCDGAQKRSGAATELSPKSVRQPAPDLS